MGELLDVGGDMHRLDAGQLASALEGELSPVLALAQSRSAEGLPGWRGIAA